MSSSYEHYVITGWKLDYKTFKEVVGELSEEGENLLNGQKDYTLITDGMNGEYAVFGTILAEGDMYNGLNFIVVPEAMEEKVNKVYGGWKKFERAADEFFQKITGHPLSDVTDKEHACLMVFTHWH